MAKEIERKFLVENLPDNITYEKEEEILQVYLNSDEGTAERIRKKGNHFFHTIKKGTGLVREEIEREINMIEFENLLERKIGNVIQKIRKEISYGKYTIELDIYQEDLAPLVVAEVEFNSVNDGKDFTAPEWFSTELTEYMEYTNKSLALNGLPKNFNG